MQKFHLECGKRFKYKIQTLCVYRTGIVYVVEDYGVSKYAPVIAALLKNPPWFYRTKTSVNHTLIIPDIIHPPAAPHSITSASRGTLMSGIAS